MVRYTMHNNTINYVEPGLHVPSLVCKVMISEAESSPGHSKTGLYLGIRFTKRGLSSEIWLSSHGQAT